MENVLSVRGSIDITAGGLPLPCSLRPRYSLALLTDVFVIGGPAVGKERSRWSGFPYHGTQWL